MRTHSLYRTGEDGRKRRPLVHNIAEQCELRGRAHEHEIYNAKSFVTPQRRMRAIGSCDKEGLRAYLLYLVYLA